MNEQNLNSRTAIENPFPATSAISPFDGFTDDTIRATVPHSSRERSASTFVPPIRSLSVRRPPLHPSTVDLQSPEQGRDTRLHHRTTSSTIVSTIQRLEELLDETVQLAHMVTDAQIEDSSPPVELFVDAARRPSAGIRSRAAGIIEEPASSPQAQVNKSKRRLKFAGEGKPEEEAETAKHKHVPDALQACGPAHHIMNEIKSSPSPAAMSEEFELKPMIPRKRRHSRRTRFLEGFEPAVPRILQSNGSLTKRDIKQYVKDHQEPPITPRSTSIPKQDSPMKRHHTFPAGLPPGLRRSVSEPDRLEPVSEDKEIDSADVKPWELEPVPHQGHETHFTQMFGIDSRQGSNEPSQAAQILTQKVDLKNIRHVDLRNKPENFDIRESYNHAPVARNWPTSRKRFTATVTCINTACIGIIIGIYAGEVPAIQYVIVDFHHYAILGNVFLYCGLAIPTLFFWPLPLLHGRKPYTVSALALALCLQIPQGVAVSEFRSPYVSTYRKILLLSRAVSGFALGFANINLQASLLDLFGASLQSSHPHEEVVDQYDVRRHGGGMGIWLCVWSSCSIGSISIGFMIGAFIVSSTGVSWGFWSGLILLLVVLLLNIIAPEPRRAAFRRTIAEMHGEGGEFSRVARGEVKMHLKGTGPSWWGEEVTAGIEMCWLMVKQPGFLVLSIYAAWVYAQFTMVLMFLGALTSTYYNFRPVRVALSVMALALGASSAMPFEKASWLSRARYQPPRTDSMTFKGSLAWSSHFIRRTLFTVLLPLSALAYTLASKGPPLPVALACLFASLVGFFSNLAIAECCGLIMETFDTSDLQPGMTGRPARKSVTEKFGAQRTNFSCYPRVCAGFAVTQCLMFIFAAAATGLCGRLERRMGAMLATGVMAAVLLGLTILLAIVLFRRKTVKMIPDTKTAVDTSTRKDTMWEPVILGKPSGTTRKISLLEAGRQTRWSEIRRKNRVNTGLTGS